MAIQIRLVTAGMRPDAFRRWLRALPAIMAWADGTITADEIPELLTG